MKYYLSFLLSLSPFLVADQFVISLGTHGDIIYTYENDKLIKIDRTDRDDNILYSHSYVYQQEDLIAENLIGDLGVVYYSKDGSSSSEFHSELCFYDETRKINQRILDGEIFTYSYDNSNQLQLSPKISSYAYDDSGNITHIENKHFEYQNDQLIGIDFENIHVKFMYDSNGRRIEKSVNGSKEQYIYFNNHEIATLDESGTIKELRIPGMFFQKGLFRSIAIETPTAIYAPIHDIQGNIIKLIDIQTKEVLSLAKPDPFGKEIDPNTPTSWIFSGKHFDKESNLVYFGARYYSPDIHK